LRIRPNIRRAKGLRKTWLRNITHDDYKICLLDREEQMRKMNVIRSHLHNVFTEEVGKVAFQLRIDKRVILKDVIYTSAYGHYKMINQKQAGFD